MCLKLYVIKSHVAMISPPFIFCIARGDRAAALVPVGPAYRRAHDGGEVGGFGAGVGKIQVIQLINHDGEVNRARCERAETQN